MRQDPKTIIDITQDPAVSRSPVESVIKPIPGLPNLPKYHWKASPPDPRDYIYQITNETSQPSTVDLRPYCSPVDDQGNLGSCTGNAMAGAIDLMDKKRYNKTTRVSRLFIYYYERYLEGTVNYDSGAYVRDALRATNTYGAPLETLWPYDITKFKTKPTTAAITDGANRKVTSYMSVANHAAALNALSNGYPVIIGFTVYSSFESGNWYQANGSGIMPYPNTTRESVLGGHCVLLVGYDMTHNYYIVRNSWGPNWAKGGYFYMPFSVIQNTSMSSDFWAVEIANDPT
jgi:C1A family cysteine protease